MPSTDSEQLQAGASGPTAAHVAEVLVVVTHMPDLRCDLGRRMASLYCILWYLPADCVALHFTAQRGQGAGGWCPEKPPNIASGAPQWPLLHPQNRQYSVVMMGRFRQL